MQQPGYKLILGSIAALFLGSMAAAPAFGQMNNAAGNVLPSKTTPMQVPGQKRAAPQDTGAEVGKIKKWAAPGSVDEMIEEQKKPRAPAHVRLGMQLVPYHKQVTNNQNEPGQATRFVPATPLRRTLRSQINRANHFFVGDWHVETVPLQWDRQSMTYKVRVKVHRRYGAFGQLEEYIGSVDLAGKLIKQEDRLFVLQGRVARQFRDRMQNPFLDLVVGDGPIVKVPAPAGKLSTGPKVERAQRARPRNSRSGSPYIRGRL